MIISSGKNTLHKAGGAVSKSGVKKVLSGSYLFSSEVGDQHTCVPPVGAAGLINWYLSISIIPHNTEYRLYVSVSVVPDFILPNKLVKAFCNIPDNASSCLLGKAVIELFNLNETSSI